MCGSVGNGCTPVNRIPRASRAIFSDARVAKARLPGRADQPTWSDARSIASSRGRFLWTGSDRRTALGERLLGPNATAESDRCHNRIELVLEEPREKHEHRRDDDRVDDVAAEEVGENHPCHSLVIERAIPARTICPALAGASTRYFMIPCRSPDRKPPMSTPRCSSAPFAGRTRSAACSR